MLEALLDAIYEGDESIEDYETYPKSMLQDLVCLHLSRFLDKNAFDDIDKFEDHLVWEMDFNRREIAELTRCRSFPMLPTVYDKQFSY